ncbi:hypothetical protein [Leptothermofonsia sp. ETS-13]|uniref:hypothetical protein n=1 Tax=Leptothermofonsia sp. ETS-13 TaxID=3035696 RepID=UPI003B9E6DFD
MAGDLFSMGFSSKQEFLGARSFQPCQIVCLEHETSRLYAEVIQIVESRQICWVRPLILAVDASLDSGQENATDLSYCYDLRSGADLLYPLVLFRTVLDSEVIPLLAFLYNPERELRNHPSNQSGHQQFRQLIQKIWQAYPEAF